MRDLIAVTTRSSLVRYSVYSALIPVLIERLLVVDFAKRLFVACLMPTIVRVESAVEGEQEDGRRKGEKSSSNMETGLLKRFTVDTQVRTLNLVQYCR